MLGSAYVKATVNAAAAFQAISNDMWTANIAPLLEPTDILQMIAVDHEWKKLMKDPDLWLNKLTVLTMQYPALEHMDQGSEEPAFSWFWRCYHAVGSGESLAARHYGGEHPFLLLHGSVDGTTFTPHSQLRFPIEYGVIVELMDLLARGGVAADPAMDATLLFTGAPAGVAIDGSFRRIHKQVLAERTKASRSDLRELPRVLCKVYAPRDRDSSELVHGKFRAGSSGHLGLVHRGLCTTDVCLKSIFSFMNYARLLGTGMFCRTEGGCVATLTLARPTRITLVSNCGKLLLRFAIH
jgi:hypothetical protein